MLCQLGLVLLVTVTLDCLISSLFISVHHPSHKSIPGKVLTCGEGDVGQLGLGEDVMERERPAIVNIPDPVIQVYGGGMHTVCLTEKGEVSQCLSQ